MVRHPVIADLVDGNWLGTASSGTFLLFFEQGKSKPSQRILDLIAKRTFSPVSFFLAHGNRGAGALPESPQDLVTEMVSVAARLRQMKVERAQRHVDQEALELFEVSARQGAQLVRSIQQKPSGRNVELRIAGMRHE